MTDRDLDQLCVNTIRFLAADAVQQAKSGHPGLPMGAAPMAYVLWTRFLRHHPADPAWPDRDRFVLSAGHGSMLLYALLHLTGYDLPLEEIKRFRQWGSKTPGHPEFGRHPGRRGHDRPARPGIRQRRRHGHRRAPPRRPVQPAGPHHRRPPHLRPLLGRRPHGGRRGGGGVPRGAPRARQADRPLRRQPGVARGEGGAVVLGGRAAAVRGARMAHADRPRRQRPRRDRQGHPGRAGGDDTPVSHRRADGDRLRSAEEGRDPRGPRRAAGRRGAPRREAGPRLAARAAVPPPGARRSRRFREALTSGARAEAEWRGASRRLAPGLPGPRDPVGPRSGAGAHAGLGPGSPAVPGGRAGGDPRRERRRARGRVPPAAASGGRRRRPRPVDQDARQDGGVVPPRHARGAAPPLRRARARDGIHRERHHLPRRAARVLQHVLRLLRLHAAGGAAGRALRAARRVRLDPRLDRGRRGRADAPAGRAPGGAARDAEPGRRPARRRHRDGGGLAGRARAPPRPDGAGPHAAEGARARPDGLRAGRGSPARRLRARGGARRRPRARPDRDGLGGPARRRRAGRPREGRHPRARRQHALVGAVRRRVRGLPGDRCCPGPCRGGSRWKRARPSDGSAGSGPPASSWESIASAHRRRERSS